MSTQLSEKNNRNIAFIVILMAVLTIATMDLYIPSLPAIMHYFSASESDVQWLIVIYMIGFSLSHIIYGPLTDRFGRRPILLFGLGLSVLGTLMILMITHFYSVLAGRLLQGIGFAACSMLSRAMLRDCFKDEMLAKVGSTIGMATSVTVGLAPSLGGIIQLVGGWKVNFGLILLLTLFSFIYVYFKLPETVPIDNETKINLRSEMKSYLNILMNTEFLINTCIAGLAFGGILAYAATAPFIIQLQLSYNSFQFGLLSFLIAIVQVLGYRVNGKMVEKHGALNCMYFGAFYFLSGSLILIVFSMINMTNILTLMAGFLLFVFGTGFIYANAYSRAFSLFDSKIGNTAAIYGLVQLGCAFIIGFILTLITEKTMFMMGLVFLCLSTLTFILLRAQTIKEKIEIKNLSRKLG